MADGFRHFAMVGGGRCHPLTVLDDHLRYSIRNSPATVGELPQVMGELVTMFRQYGLPVQMLMDNGSPWGDCGGQSAIVTSWLVRLKFAVSHRHIRRLKGRTSVSIAP